MSSQQHSLKPFNTFNLDRFAQELIIATTPEALSAAWQESQLRQQPVLLIGEGSNILFLDDFQGKAIINRIKGIAVKEGAEAWHLHVGAGENWHQLVKYTLEKGLPGLENMAMIPGCTGSAPIQNIGAYGVELKSICEYVDVLHLATGEIERLPTEACQFGYRDSIFKHKYQYGYAIVAVGLILNKKWQPVLSYGDLGKLSPQTATPQQIFDTVCQMRSSKLPDPAKTGNAGSFFKNPVVSVEQANAIMAAWPDAPRYPQADGSVKLAAGWLIDRCDLKGFAIGGAAVHQQQALVLINQHQATSGDIVALAHEVRQRVGQKFNVWLEPEVRFIGAQGEQDAVGVIA
ncbi:UDP-N-acetylmuramate dehydrogenase [Kalamiella sp. sgz302252]|uniref:UDP-N-acetylmuramate dehydrogenase n=1 Tax=Pantoea sp. sgz302252 TaxID=3341827 RepID=UPI0036D361BC